MQSNIYTHVCRKPSGIAQNKSNHINNFNLHTFLKIVKENLRQSYVPNSS